MSISSSSTRTNLHSVDPAASRQGPNQHQFMTSQPPHIAILNANWKIYSNIGYMAESLAKEGYAVDVLLYWCDERMSGAFHNDSPRVKIHRFDGPTNPDGAGTAAGAGGIKNAVRHLVRKILPVGLRFRIHELKHYLLLKTCPTLGLIPRSVVQKVARMAVDNAYVALIGVEKGGLVWAGMVAAQTKTPVVYFSLELFCRDDPFVVSWHWLKRLKVLEERYHPRCALTIVQDEHRGRVLLADNGIHAPVNIAYFPYSQSGPAIRERSQWLQTELGLASDKVIILQYGEIGEQRCCVDATRLAQEFPKEWHLVFHGFGEPDYIEKIRAADAVGRVSCSLKLLPADQVERVARSARIGLALYEESSINNRLTGLSSEKIALYLRCGLPLIAFRYPSYEHIEAEGAGLLVDRLEDIPAAIETILKGYDKFVSDAYACYAKHYCFEKNFSTVATALRQLRSAVP